MRWDPLASISLRVYREVSHAEGRPVTAVTQLVVTLICPVCQHRQEASEDLRAVISHKHWQTGKRHAYQLLKPAELIRFLVTTEAGGVGRQACCENCGTNGVLAPGDEVSLQQYVAEYLTVDEFKRALHSLDFVVDESNQIFEYRPGEAPEDVVLL